MSTNPAETAGPNGDGSKSLARESKVGGLVFLVAGTVMTWIAQSVGEVDWTPLPDWLEAIVVPAVTTAIALGVAYFTPNRAARRANAR